MGNVKTTKVNGKEVIQVFCDYCQKEARLKEGRNGKFWECSPCDATVGVHKNSDKFMPYGRLADKELRYWRIMAHEAFDPLWETKKHRKTFKIQNRNDCYKWLSRFMKMKHHESHIAMMDIDQCKQVVKICNAAQEGISEMKLLEMISEPA